MSTAIKKSADAQARDHTDAAIQALADVLTSEFAEPKDKIRAAEALLDRGNGKPVNAVISIPLERRQHAQLATMSDEDLMNYIRETPLPRLMAPEEETYTCNVKGCPGDHDNELELCGEVVKAKDPLLL